MTLRFGVDIILYDTLYLVWYLKGILNIWNERGIKYEMSVLRL